MERIEQEKMYLEMTDNEKAGISFGLFPARLIGMTHEDICWLMQTHRERKALAAEATQKARRGKWQKAIEYFDNLEK